MLRNARATEQKGENAIHTLPPACSTHPSRPITRSVTKTVREQNRMVPLTEKKSYQTQPLPALSQVLDGYSIDIYAGKCSKKKVKIVINSQTGHIIGEAVSVSIMEFRKSHNIPPFALFYHFTENTADDVIKLIYDYKKYHHTYPPTVSDLIQFVENLSLSRFKVLVELLNGPAGIMNYPLREPRVHSSTTPVHTHRLSPSSKILTKEEEDAFINIFLTPEYKIEPSHDSTESDKKPEEMEGSLFSFSMFPPLAHSSPQREEHTSKKIKLK